MKFLLILCLLVLVAWCWRRLIAPRPPVSAPSAPARLEDMPACAHCGLHLPRSAALPGPDGSWFCCEAHRQAGRAGA